MALGRSQLKDVFGARLGTVLMALFGQMATGFLHLPVSVGAPLASPPAGGWPVAVVTHSLTAWGLSTSSPALSLASHGVVVAVVDHCDGSACVASMHGSPRRVLVPFAEWQEKRRQILLEEPTPSEEQLRERLRAWRHEQNNERLVEIDAVLNGLNGALAAVQEPSGVQAPSGLARVDRSVLLIGMSMGGATASAAALRDSGRPVPRVAHIVLLDPWLDQLGVSPLAATDLARPFSAALRTCTIWLNGGSQVYAASLAPAETLIVKAHAAGAAAAELIAVPHAGHYAQTDVPSVFEHGPLRCVYLLIKGRSQNVNAAPAAQDAIRQCVGKMIRVLDEDGWIG